MQWRWDICSWVCNWNIIRSLCANLYICNIYIYTISESSESQYFNNPSRGKLYTIYAQYTIYNIYNYSQTACQWGGRSLSNCLSLWSLSSISQNDWRINMVTPCRRSVILHSLTEEWKATTDSIAYCLNKHLHIIKTLEVSTCGDKTRPQRQSPFKVCESVCVCARVCALIFTYTIEWTTEKRE